MKTLNNGMRRALYALEGIPIDYPIALLDANFLIEVSRAGEDRSRMEFFDFFHRYLQKTKRLYTTEDILHEYRTIFPSEDVVRLLTDNKLVVDLRSLELYRQLEKKYAHFKRFYRFNISRADLDFLVSGAVMSDLRDSSCALVSNDLGLLSSWRRFLECEEGFDSKRLGFFTFDLSKENPGVFSGLKLNTLKTTK